MTKMKRPRCEKCNTLMDFNDEKDMGNLIYYAWLCQKCKWLYNIWINKRK